MATFPGKPPNPLGVKVELSLNSVWTDITVYVMLRDLITISNMGRADESASITASQLTLTLRNDGRFTPKNASGAYYPYIVRNTQIRVSVNATSLTGVAYSQYRYSGEIASWPPSFDISQRDTFVQVTASGIWRRISANQANIGSAYARYVSLQTGTLVPAAYWAMEDGTNTTGFVLSEGTGTNFIATGTPSYAADNTSFAGSNAIPQLNTARLAGNVSSGATPTNNVVQFALSVPAAGDSTGITYAAGSELCKILSGGTIGRIDISLIANQLHIAGYLTSAGGTAQFSGTVTTKVNGVPVLVSVEITPSGGSINWALRIIKPGAGSVLDQVTGTRAASSIAAVTQVQLNGQGRLTDTACGQLGVFYAVPTLVSSAFAIGGNAGEGAVTRFSRLCAESNIPATVIGSGGAAMGPQADGTMASVLQSIEDADGGLLYETRDTFGLGYRTLASMQNQSAAVSFAFTAGVLGAPLVPTYDDQLVVNQWMVTNWDGYAALAQLTSGAISVLPPPNGVGSGYSRSKTINASTHAQVNAIAQQLLFEGTVDDLRFPVVTFNFQRAQAAPFFASVPGLRIGDYLSVSSLPGYLGGGTAKQLIWGYTERMGGEIPGWTIDYNTINEAPFETAFSPGVFSVTQVPAGAVAAGSSVGSSVSGAQLGAGSVPATALSNTITARTIGGTLQIIGPATPYDWTFAVSGTPADVNYFICTQDQSLPIAVGDTFTNSGGLGGPFTITSVDSPAGGNVTVHFTPAASSVMSTGTLTGGKNGDQWINSSGGNQLSQWAAGAWTPITWDGTAVINAGTITATQILAGTITATQIAAGIIIAGVVNGTTITGATIIADGASGEFLAYSGSPATGNLIVSVSGAAGTDGFSNAYAQGLEVHLGGIVLDNQSSGPTAVTGASVLYSSTAGRPRYLSQSGSDSILQRSGTNVSQFTVGNTATNTIISAPLAYFANEGNQNSEFEIQIDGTATGGTSGQNLNFALFSDGVQIGGAFTVGSGIIGAGITAGKGFGYTIRFRLTVLTTGAGGTANTASDGVFYITATNFGNNTASIGNQTPVGAVGPGKAFDTTSAHTLQAYASWGATSTGQALTTYTTRLTRRN